MSQHIEIARTRKSLRKHFLNVEKDVIDIEHFKIPTHKPKYVNGKLAYCPRTHIACVVTKEHMVFVGVSRPHPNYDIYNAKVGLEIAFGRALFAHKTSPDPLCRRRSFEPKHGRHWTDFALEDKGLTGYRLRNACRDLIPTLGILTREEMYEWTKMSKLAKERLTESAARESVKPTPPTSKASPARSSVRRRRK